MKRSRSWSRTTLHGLLVGYCTLAALPFLWMVFASLKTVRETFAEPFSLPATPQWQNYAEAWSQGLSQYLFNSALVTVIAVVLIVAVGGMAAYALARLRFPGRTGIYLFLIVGYAIPAYAVLVPLYELLQTLGLLNTYVGLIGSYVAFGIPFSVLLLYVYFRDFPRELEEAARLDGCTYWQLLLWVFAPLSRPALLSVALFQGIFIFNEFLLALIIISDDALKTVPLGLLAFRGEFAVDWPLLLAALTITTVPFLLLFLAMQKYFYNSLTGFSKG